MVSGKWNYLIKRNIRSSQPCKLATYSTIIALLIASIANPKEIPVGFTISGGTSYGSYQAGCLYMANNWLRVNRESYKVRVVTGTSAGSINAILTALSLGDTTFVSDTQSLFYKTWIKIGYEQLKNGKSPLGALGRDFFYTLRNDLISPYFTNPPNSDTVDLLLGLSTTCLTPIDVKVTDDLHAPTVEERFTIRMTRNGSGPWKTRNYIDSSSKQSVTILPLGNDDNCKLITDIAFASSGIPGAFDPMPIKLMRIVPSEMDSLIKKDIPWIDTGIGSLWKSLLTHNFSHVTPLYVDGGVFDKAPLRCAIDIASRGLKIDSSMDGTTSWNDIPVWNDQNPILDSMIFVCLNQENTAFPHVSKHQKSHSGSLIGTFMKMSENFIKSAHSKEMSIIAERFPQCEPLISQNFTPLMSGYLFDLLGFFEKPFRDFDFFAGMYDAERFIRKHSSGDKLVSDDGASLYKVAITDEMRFDKRFQLTRQVLDLIYQIVDTCDTVKNFIPDSLYWELKIKGVNHWFDSVYYSTDHKTQIDLEQHAKMLQTSIDRLWARWMIYHKSRKNENYVAIRHADAWKKMIGYRPHFFAASLKLQPISTQNFHQNVVKPIDSEDGGSSKTEFDALLYLLDHYNYKYEDIKTGKRASEEEVKKILCSNFLYLTRNIGKHQKNKTERNLFLHTSKPALNLFSYTPPDHSYRVGAGVGGLLLSYGHLLSDNQILNRFQWEMYGNIEKGSKHNKRDSGAGYYTRFYPSFSLNSGLLLDISRNAKFQLRYGVSGGIGKDWTKNNISDSFIQNWTIGFSPITVQGSLYETLFLRLSWNPARPINFSNSNSGVWDWDNIHLQLGMQLVR